MSSGATQVPGASSPGVGIAYSRAPGSPARRGVSPGTLATGCEATPLGCCLASRSPSRVLGLREPEYLPLRILRDSELIAERAPQADPLLGVLAALGSMPPGWRALAQLVLQPAPRDWARRHLRRSLEHALEPERAERVQSGRIGSVGWSGVVVAAAFLAAVIVLPRLWALYVAHGWLPLALLGVPATIGLLGLYALWLRLVDRPLYDLELVKEKLSRPAARAELRLVVFAPMEVAPADVQARLEHVAAAYRAYDLERGNGLVARSLALPDASDALCAPVPVGARSTIGHPHHP